MRRQKGFDTDVRKMFGRNTNQGDSLYALDARQIPKLTHDEKRRVRKRVVWDPLVRKWRARDFRICPLCKKPYVEDREYRCVYCGTFLRV